MRFLLLLLLSGLFAISSCRKDDIEKEEADHSSSYWIKKYYVGDWNLSAEAYEKGYYDSIVVFNEPQLHVTFTDSLLDVEESVYGPYYYGVFYEGDENIDFMYQTYLIRLMSHPNEIISLRKMYEVEWNKYIQLEHPVTETDFNDEVLWIKNTDEPFQHDSIKYRIVFNRPPPNVGLMVRYIDSEGEYTIDTLKSGNWQWEKKVFQTTDSKKYHLEIIGATESFYENIPHSYSFECSLIMQTAAYPIQYSDGSVILNRVHPVFHKDLGTVTFSEPEGRRHARMVFENVD